MTEKLCSRRIFRSEFRLEKFRRVGKKLRNKEFHVLIVILGVRGSTVG